jgi:DNA polymerase III alpha subunit
MENKQEIIPIFYDHTSQKSIITPWLDSEVKPNGPPSALKLAKEAGLKKVHLVSSNFYSFIEAWKNAQKMDLQLIFGLEIWLCKDAHDQSPASIPDESKVIVWIRDGKGYEQAIKIYSEIYKDSNNKYYHMRGSWQNLKNHWCEQLTLTIPFFDSFLHRNLLNHDSSIVPDFPCEPYFQIEVDSGIPFAPYIEEAIATYGAKEDRLIKTKTIFYEKKKDMKAWQILRSINLHSDFGNPEIPFCVSNNFSFEDYLFLTK